MNWDQLVGHELQRERLQSSLHRGRMSHAFLLTGPAGIGKRRFAECVASSLLCAQTGDDRLECCGECSSCRQVDAGTHPDLSVVELPDGKLEIPIAAFAGAPERRGKEGLCYWIALRPAVGQRKVAIIDDAERMNAAAANALLKTLEEPPAGAMILLIASDPSALLPTIRSRCQRLQFLGLSPAEVEQVLAREAPELPQTQRRQAAELSEGSAGLALQIADSQLEGLRAAASAAFGAGERFDSVQTAQRILKQIDEIAANPAESRAHAAWLIRFLVNDLATRLRHRIASQDQSGDSMREPAQVEVEQITGMIERCLQAEQQLSRAMPVPLCLEGLFDDLGRNLASRLTV